MDCSPLLSSARPVSDSNISIPALLTACFARVVGRPFHSVARRVLSGCCRCVVVYSIAEQVVCVRECVLCERERFYRTCSERYCSGRIRSCLVAAAPPLSSSSQRGVVRFTITVIISSVVPSPPQRRRTHCPFTSVWCVCARPVRFDRCRSRGL